MPEWMSVKPNQVMLILYSDQVIQSGVCRCKFAAWYVLIANIPEIIFFINVFLCLNLVGFGFSFMLFNATFNNISVNRAGQVYWGMKPEDLEKTTDLSHVTDKLYHLILYTLPWSRFELTTSVMKGTDCIGSCKSNYHTITAMTAPNLVGKMHSR